MKAAVIYAVNEPLVVEEIELDPPKDREVLVRYVASGVCHSDLHIMRGTIPRPMPMVLGHEGAGIVEAVGPNVTLVKPGDHVVLSWVPSCGVCHSCTTGRMYLCDTAAQLMYEGFMLDGTIRMHKGEQPIRHMNMLSTFAERAVVPESACIPIRKDMPLDRAALLGCAVMTGVGAALLCSAVAGLA
jgi:S-(hydroxymethyl)glutathione dehydrogenase/alcohol dehydrogenase